MKYKIYISINNTKLKPAYETVKSPTYFVGKLKFFTEVGYTIHKIERVE